MTDIQQAKEWADTKPKRLMADDTLAAVEVIQSLPDQIVDGSRLRQIIDFQGTGISDDARKDLEALLTPSPPTLAELIELGNKPEDYQWAWVDTKDGLQVITTAGDFNDEHAYVMDKDGRRFAKGWSQIRPRTDLPRLEWPEVKP